MPLEAATAIPDIQTTTKHTPYIWSHNRHYVYHKDRKESQTFKHLGEILYLHNK
jgi:hypothetical protein